MDTILASSLTFKVVEALAAEVSRLADEVSLLSRRKGGKVEKLFYTNSEVMETFGISEGTLKTWRIKAILPGKKVLGTWYYSVENVMKVAQPD